MVALQSSVVAAPPDRPSVSYQEIRAAGGGKVLLAIARPGGRVKGPALLILHGTHGFADEYVEIAREVAATGHVAVVACWFAPGAGPGMRFITPRKCPSDTPGIVRGDEPEAQERTAGLVQAVARLPGVNDGRVVVMGHSRGGGAALYYALGGGRADGVIINSGPYPPDAVERASAMAAPVLILHGEKDGSSDGGSEMTSALRAHAFASALEQAGRRVTTEFYDQGGHNSLFTDPDQRRTTLASVVRFLDSFTVNEADQLR